MIFKPGHSSDSLYRSLVEHSPFCIHGIDADRRLSFINPAGLRMLTIQSERSVVGQPYLSFVDVENRARVARLLDLAFEGKPSSFDFVCDVGGRRREFASTFIPVQDADGTVGTVMGTSQDVTDERIAERQLEQSRRALQDAQSRACLGSWEYDPAVDETIWSDEMYRLYYRDPRQGAPQTIEQFLDLLHPADRALALDRHHRILNSDQPVKNLDLRTNPQHGPVRWLESTAARVADPSDRKRFRVVGTAMDVTERKWTENALRESEHRFRTLCTHSAMGIFLTDVQGHCTYLNEAGCAITGLTALQSAGQGWARALHPDDRQRIVTEWSRAIERQAEFNVECRFLHSDGEIVWARVRSSLHRNDQGKVIGYIGSFVDITQEKTSQEKLLQSERRYRALVEHAPEAIVVFDPQSGRFVDFNDNALKLFGCDAEQLRCCNPFELSPPRQPDGRSSVEAAQGYIDQSLAGEFPVFEWVHRNTDGDDIACEIRLLRLELDSRTLIRGSVTDIRDRKRAEQQLRMTHFALESTDDAIFVIDRESRFVDVNAVACTRLGYRRDELLAMSVSDINPEYPITAWNRHWLDLKESGRLVFESTHQKSDGTRFPVEISKSYFEFDGNQYAFAFVRGIGQKKVSRSVRINWPTFPGYQRWGKWSPESRMN